MKQVVKMVRKSDIEKQYTLMLQLELDYELATLFDAMQQHNEKDIEKSKKRLAEIHKELEVLHVYA
ncbi:hypothetical protein GCM10007425_13920 [Lysinibacillus alkalisoli]|uniref:Uncharacterized protein n=1 Tax=Lysinibacillus alkalisoli TaxID=1911548 RepID=A0A917G3K9_9BACI|nr:hypothetical protein [Lysinibacillus alkalisoli]GGG20722.1 hypothetical protein GCM10007425_13920 [Lysinibacillus alkalisoli]